MVWLGLPELRYSHLLPPGTTPHSWGDDDLALAAVPLYTREGLFASLRASCKHV